MPFVDFEACRIDLRVRAYQGPEGKGTLTETEARLLAYLVQRPRVDVSRDELLVEVWRHPSDSLSRVVDTTMRRLRAKLERVPARPRHLLTRHGHGYRFEPLQRLPSPSASRVPPLIGREAERARLVEISTEPCVTLFGPGGIGKSALARAVYDDLLAPVSEVALQAVADGASLVAAIARARGLRLGESSIEGLVEALGPDATGTLVLDTAEHIVDPIRNVVSAVVRGCPNLRLVVTSRTVLGLDVEHLVEVPPLDDVAGAQLVRDRAWQLGVEIPEGPASAMARRLSGVPLAIELAAAQCRTLAPDDLLARLDQDVRWLKSRHPTDDERHRTLVDALAWSWTLLDEGQRTAARQLAVFPGSFDLRAAEAVIEVPDRDGLDLLGDLIDTSWVWRHDRRYRLLDPVRDYLRGQPADPRAGQRHVGAMTALVLSVLDESGAVRHAEARPVLNAHLQDFLVAFDHAASTDRPTAMAILAFGIQRVLRHAGPADQLGSVLDRAWARREALDDRWRSVVGCALAHSRAEALAPYDEPLEDARAAAIRTGHDGVLGRFLALEGMLLLRGSDLAHARDTLAEAVMRSQRGKWPYFAAHAQTNLAYVLWTLGEVDAAIEAATAARRGFADLGAQESVQGVDEVLAGMQCAAGRHDEGLPRLERVQRAAEASGRQQLVLATHLQMAMPLIEIGELDAATKEVEQAMAIIATLDHREFDVDSRYLRGVLSAVRGDVEAADRSLRDAQLRGEDGGYCPAGIGAWRVWASFASGRQGEGRMLIECLPAEADIPRDDDRALVRLARSIEQPRAALDEAVAATASSAARSIVVRLFRRQLLDSSSG